MDFDAMFLRVTVKRTYLLAAIVYALSLLLRIVAPYFVAIPSIVGESNRPLAGILRFIFNELSTVISPIAASFCLIIALTLHLTVISKDKDVHDKS